MTGRLLLAILPTLAGWFLSPDVQAQERCSTTKNEAERLRQRPRRETPEQFEQWMKAKLSAAPQIMSATYTIPVVVHVIHNGTSDVTNISDAQILSQIDVLNKDFKRLNLDASNTPLVFQGVAAGIDIDFILAKRDPEGLATNGITRTLGTQAEWSMADQSDFKALNYWPAEDYLNIWVLNFGTNDIGFAQFPVSSTLAGLEMGSEDRLTDGIVIDYRAFGTSDAGSFPLLPNFNKGRTATHEIGHFLGLRHIWGDMSSCADNDFVADTPGQTSATAFCPTHPQPSCTPNKMFMNYMDYTNDVCMNLFTAGQVARMVVVLAESPRRLSLLSSLGATVPVVALDDLGIRNVVSPGLSTCNTITPVVEFRNYGTNTVTAATIEIQVIGFPGLTTQVPLSVNLLPGAITLQNLGTIPISPGATYDLQFTILNTNGGVDGNPQNNQRSQETIYHSNYSLPISEAFDIMPPNWTNNNPDNLIGWENAAAPDNSPANRAMKLDFYNYDLEGVLDWLISPSFLLATPSTSLLRFDVAYAQYPGQQEDALRVYALPYCSTDLNQAVLLYEKTGASLATAPATSNDFMPTSNAQWRKSEVLGLSSLPPGVRWQIAFVGKNGFGNNLYVDNVLVTDDEIFDIALGSIITPGIVHCEPNPTIRFNVVNLGTVPITEFRATYNVEGGTTAEQMFTGLQLGAGESGIFELNPIALPPGLNQVHVSLSLTSGIDEVLLDNNAVTITSVLDLSQDKAPLRKTFDNPLEQSWRVASPSEGLDWENAETNKEQSISYRSFSNPSVGQESWLVSPILDLSLGTFSLFFDVSYATNPPSDERLLILASRDCGMTYDEVLMDRAASSFTTLPSTTVEWQPTNGSDWQREYVDLSTLANQTNVRIAFVARNDNGNNLFLDNIELFLGDDPNPPVTSSMYQLYYSTKNLSSDVAMTLHLDVRQDVPLQILSIQGNLVQEHVLTDALNQTYYFDLSQQTSGIYIFRLLINNRFYATKVFIGH